MRFSVLSLFAGSLCCVCLASSAAAQSALEKLEQQVRNRGASDGAAETTKPSSADDNTGYLGVVADDRLDLGKGVRIMEVLRGSPAERSGLKSDDLVTGVAGKPVKSMDDFARILAPAPAGSRLQFEIKRNRKQQQLEVTLGTRPPQDERPFADFGQIPDEAPVASQAQDQPHRPGLLGVRVDAVTPETQAKFDLPSDDGALIVHINENSPGQKAGLPMSGVIIGVNEKRVLAPGDLKRLVASAGAGAEVMITYYYQGELHERMVRLGGPASAPPLPPAGRFPPAMIPFRPPEAASDARVEQLEQRIEQLEQRLAELEKLLSREKGETELPPPEEKP
ncbi:MAG TPA: PDZ domain-containing protein [Pirellulales bacterium]|nr:PDZ domain-containing protein [Pirellulales bacterium]